MRSKGIYIVLATILIVFAFATYAFKSNLFDLKSEEPTRKVPIQNLALPDKMSKQDYVFIQFFSSWCEACHVQHKKLMTLSQLSAFPIVGIAFQDRPEELNAFLKEEGSPYQQVTHDTTGKLALSFGLRGVPEIFLIRVKDGAVLYHNLGVFTQYNMEHTLLPLLKTLGEKESTSQ